MTTPPPIGHNRDPFDEISEKINDLFDTAKDFVDDNPIENQATADSVSKLLAMIKESAKKADDLRKAECAPHDDAKKRIQQKYAPLIADTKSVTGKTVLAIKACQDYLTPWNQKIQAEKDAKAAELRRIAEEKQRAAKAAFEKANLAEREKAEAALKEAQQAQATAKRAAKDNVKGMLTVWDLTVTDETALVRHYWTTRRPDLLACVREMAERDKRAGKRSIPGCEITSRKVAR